MATWGTKTFEDDTAADWISELIDSEESRDFLLLALTLPEDEDSDAIDYDSAAIAVIASEVIIALLEEQRKGLPDNLKDWLSENQCDDITDLPEIATPVLTKALSDNSELVTVWQEAEDYDEWREGVDELLEIMVQLADA